MLGSGVLARSGLGGAELKRLGVAGDGPLQVGWPVRAGQSGVGVAEIVLGPGVVEGGLPGTEPQRLGEAGDGLAQVGCAVAGAELIVMGAEFGLLGGIVPTRVRVGKRLRRTHEGSEVGAEGWMLTVAAGSP